MSNLRNNGNFIPESVLSEANRFFNVATVSAALKLLSSSKTSISFKKGDPETYFIVSGIVQDDKVHECKVVYKHRFENSEVSPLQSQCSCYKWTDSDHCPHTASLFLLFYLQRFVNEQEFVESNTHAPPIATGGFFGVNAREYGTIIRGPQYLMGAQANSTYSALQYLLHNQKVINFPMPTLFVGKLVVDLLSAPSQEEQKDGQYRPFFIFSYENEAGEEIKEVSIFETLYLFNWCDGACYHLSNDLKAFIQKIRMNRDVLDINNFLILFSEYHECKESDDIKIKIDGIPLGEISRTTPSPKIIFEPEKDKKQIKMILSFVNSEGANTPPPVYVKNLTFDGGELQYFKKKKDAYSFIWSIAAPEQYTVERRKKYLANHPKRNYWIELLHKSRQTGRSLQYDSQKKVLTEVDWFLQRLIISSMYFDFGEIVFKLSEYDASKEELSFVFTSQVLFAGLSSFYIKLHTYGATIYYDRNEIAKWKSRIRFERKYTTSNWFDLELTIDKQDLEVIKKTDLDQGVILTSKGLVLLEQKEKEMLRFMKKYINYEGEETTALNAVASNEKTFILPFSRARIFELFELRKMGIDGALTSQEIKLCEKLMSLTELPSYEFPKTLKGVMRPYQITGYNWLRFLHENKLGACLADDMGLGKTLQTIAFLVSIIEKVDKVLIVCPVSILINWEKEFEKFSEIAVHIYHGGGRHIPSDAKVILTSYGIMKKEAGASFANINFDVLILDEVQHLKNIRSLGAYSVRTIKADFRICLTGTPVENDLAEFYNILDLSVPGIWGDLQFVKSTSNTKTRFLARKTAGPFILRRTKKQVLTDLPPKIENNVFLTFSEEESEFYKKTLASIRDRINNAQSKNKYGEILRGLMNLRQTCLWQKQLDKICSSKIDFLLETLEQILDEGHQVLVFSQFTTYLDIIQNAISERHWKFCRIDGSQSITKRQLEVEKFQKNQSQVFLISLKAGGVGLNLTAASYVFMMDPWWNPAVEEQAIDRAHRIGQKNTLTVYRPVIKNSVEEKVLELKARKKELFMDLLPENGEGGENNDEQYFTGKLTMKDFEHLFSSDVLDTFEISEKQDF